MVFCSSVPYHITAVFIPKINNNPLTSGSIGVGISVEPRLKLCVGSEIAYNENKEAEEIPITAKNVFNRFNIDEKYILNMPLPIKIGYASSASSTIATELISFLYGKTSYMKALQDAHNIEVENSTGLGDVLAISCGIGIVLRKKEGAPGIGEVDCISFPKDVSIVTVEFGAMNTKDLLISYDKTIQTESQKVLDKILEDFSFETFSYEIKRFTDNVGKIKLLNKGDEVIKTPGLISYYMKKMMIVLLIESNKIEDALKYLRDKNLNLRILKPSSHGPEAWIT
ncbi:pantoate kinase [Caldisphaera sp.]|uniref:pantoate kinase n=1 Tax=Caldisphaera sp. TaxID=2060322 RepID=UPI003D0AE864